MVTMAAKRNPAARARPTALVRAQHDEPPVKLTTKERALLDECLARGRGFVRKSEAELIEFGAWLLTQVFQGDASAALDDKSTNPIWMALLDRAGGPTLAVSRNVLYAALKVAAYDKRITAQPWQGLDVARKTLLFPLADDHAIQKAAKHVTDFSLTQSATRQYVTALLQDEGRARQIRLTPSGLVSRVKKLRETLDTPAIVRHVSAMSHEMSAKERAEVATELAHLRDVLGRLSKAVRGPG